MAALSGTACYSGKQRNSGRKWTIYLHKYARKTYKCKIFEEEVHQCNSQLQKTIVENIVSLAL